jgi:hypothetical protein
MGVGLHGTRWKDIRKVNVRIYNIWGANLLILSIYTNADGHNHNQTTLNYEINDLFF